MKEQDEHNLETLSSKLNLQGYPVLYSKLVNKPTSMVSQLDDKTQRQKDRNGTMQLVIQDMAPLSLYLTMYPHISPTSVTKFILIYLGAMNSFVS